MCVVEGVLLTMLVTLIGIWSKGEVVVYERSKLILGSELILVFWALIESGFYISAYIRRYRNDRAKDGDHGLEEH